MSNLPHEILLALAYVSQISDPDSVRSRFIESLNELDKAFAFEFVDYLPTGVPEYRILPIATLRSFFGYAVMVEGPETAETERAVFRTAFQFLAVILENRMQARSLESRNKSLAKEIKQEKSLLHTVLDTLPVGVWVTDEKGTILMGNAAGEKIWAGIRYVGIDQYSQYKAWWSDTGKLVEPEEWSIARAIKAGETSIDQQIDIECFDGTHKNILVSAAPLIDDEQRIIGAIAVNQDITERKRAVDEMRKSEARYRSLFENNHAVILIVDPDKATIVDANDAACTYYGWSRKEIRRRRIDEINTLTSKEISAEIELARSEKRNHFFFKHRRADGTIREVEVYSGPILLKGKTLLYSIVHDITERKEAENKLLNTLESLKKAFGTIIQVMVSAVEARDPYTAGHQARSAELARAIATEMGFSQDKIDAIGMAGSIHDIGKLSIPSEILSKPTRLSEIEFSLIKQHSRSGYEILKDVESPWPLAEMVYQHHERMDGSGYPRNLKGKEILIEARILAVSDVVESMASHRPYRPALGIDAALEEIEKNKRILYDETVVDACQRLFREKSYQL